MSNERKQGQIATWIRERHCGIIQVGGVESLERYFTHTKFIRSGTAVPKTGQTVFFDVSPELPRKEGMLPVAIRVDVVVAETRPLEAL